MFDVGWSELVVIGVVALVVIGPKELPGVIRTVGKAVGKLRTMAGEFRGQFDDAMREAELHEVKKTFTEATDVASSAMNSVSEPFSTIHDDLKGAVDGVKEDVGTLNQPSETVASIQADAASMEAEVKEVSAAPAPEPDPAPKKRRKKAADDAGDAT